MLVHKYKRNILAILLIITSLVSFLNINPNIVLAKLIIDDYEVSIAEADGTFTKIGNYATYSEAKNIMDENENSVIRHNGSKSPLKIIAMREGEGIAIAYPYRTGSGSINNSLVILYPNSGLSNAYTYIPSYYDLEYFKTESNFNPSTGKASVQVRINGYKGYADLRHLDLIPYNFVKNHVDVQIGGKPYNGDTSNYPIRTTSAYQNYYKVSNGELFHYTRNYKSNKYNGSYVIGKAHKDMTDGNYYSFDGIHFFNDSELTDPVLDSNGSPIEHYNYFQYLPLRSKTNHTGTDLNNYLKSLGYTKLATSPYQSGATILHEKGPVFVKSQEKYGLNGLMVFSIANHESAYGRSAYAVNRYNLYGWNAIDSNPDKAKDFNSVDHCVTEMMGYNLQGYMSNKTAQYGENREDGRHFGTHVGNKQSGMNVKYASDPYWGEKISGHAYRADKYLKNKDYDYYTIGVTKNSSIYNVRKESNTSNTPISQLANATFGGIKNMPVLVLDEVTGQNVSGNDKWYQIMSNHPLDSKGVITYHEEDDKSSAEVPYNYFTSNAYTHSGGIKIVNGSLKHTWPGKLTKEQESKKLTTNIEQIEWKEDKLYIKGYSYHEDLSLPYISYKGETWTSHNIIFVDESDNKKRYEYKLSSKNLQILNTDSKVYDAAFFEKEIDVLDLPFGKYNVYIKTVTHGYTFEDNLLNSKNLSLPSSKKINASRFVLENINKSKDLLMTVSNISSKPVGPTEPTEPTKPSKPLSLYLQDFKWKDMTLDVRGYGYLVGANHLKDKTTHNLVFVNDENKEYSFYLDYWDGQWDMTDVLNDGKDYSNVWYEKQLDITALPPGDYRIYIEIITDEYENRVELSNYYNLTIPIAKEDDSNNFRFYQNNMYKKRMELALNLGTFISDPNIEFPSKKGYETYLNEIKWNDKDNDKLEISGYGMIHGINNDKNTSQSIILFNHNTGEKVEYPLDYYEGLWNMTSVINDGFNYDYAWYKKVIDLSNLNTGRYKLYIKTKIKDTEAHTEIVDLYNREIPINKTIDSKEYNILRNDITRNRVEIIVK